MSYSKREGDRTRLDGFEIDIFKLVLDGATSEQWKEWLRVPLEHAAADGDMDLFTRLMDAGADSSAGWRGCYGRTLLGAAAHGKNEKMVQCLLKAGAKAEVNVLFNEEEEESGPTSALHVAAKQGADGVSRALMVAGANPNQRGADNQTPLHLAAKEGHHVVVDNLILKGANIEAKTDYFESTALHIAAENGEVLCVSALLLGGANKESLDLFEKTPLLCAAKRGHLKVADELMAAGADVGIRDSYNFSALDEATSHGHVEVVKSILRHGGDVRACDSHGLTALHKINVEADLVVPVLLAAGVDVDAASIAGMTPLFHAARPERQVGATQALLEAGANVNVCDRGWSTALHAACENSRVGAVELLLRWGADETRTKEDGNKPFDVIGEWLGEVDGAVLDDDDRERSADDQRIRQMLVRAPADRAWRRRGWLVLCRSCPARVQLATDDDSSRSTKAAKVSVEDSGGVGDGAGDETIDLGRLVERVVGLDVDGVFRLVVGFL